MSDPFDARLAAIKKELAEHLEYNNATVQEKNQLSQIVTAALPEIKASWQTMKDNLDYENKHPSASRHPTADSINLDRAERQADQSLQKKVDDTKIKIAQKQGDLSLVTRLAGMEIRMAIIGAIAIENEQPHHASAPSHISPKGRGRQ